MTLKEFAVARHACAEGLDWLGERDLEAMWAECQRSDWMLWLLEKIGWDDDHAQRTFALRSARRVQHLMMDARSVACLDVVERYLVGEATEEEVAAAWAVARAAAWAVARAAAWAAAGAARAAARAAAGTAAWDAWAAAGTAAWDAGTAAWAAQADDLRDIVPVATLRALFEDSLNREES